MEITKQFKFELSHRLVDSYSTKCQNIHGHSYLCDITLSGEHLDSTGMLMDFGQVKDKLNHLFDAWDHSFMFWSKDSLANHYKAMMAVEPLRMIEVDYNPTAEGMTYHVFRACVQMNLPVSKVRIQETLTGWATTERLKPFFGEDVTYYNIPEIKKQLGGRVEKI